MNNERGGIISSLFIIPVGVALLIGVFLLGYYVGRYHNKIGGQGENLVPLPDVASEKLPKPEDFTFFKSLTEKENKTVSIDLKPKSSPDESAPDKKQAGANAPKESAGQTASKTKDLDIKIEKKSSDADTIQQKAYNHQEPHEKKKDKSLKKTAPSKLHYTVQVASYPEIQLANDEAKKMRSRGYAAFIVPSEVPGKGTWYRVRLGSFTKKDSAEKLAKEIQAKVGISSIITLE
ncbi:MAG TPA: SPOR domain-containing protein [Nitrospirota bacterium]|nr:SPOR domain-containing protein [Nitrospirota bacterium]